VEAERCLGATNGRIVLRHILPNVLAPLLILAAMDLPVVITFEAGLSFLGLGVRPPTPSWGIVLSEGFNYIRQTPWPITWAGVALIITTLGFTLFGESLRDVLDPRLSGTRGF
jgi:peptide/nickel transport system permease protein